MYVDDLKISQLIYIFYCESKQLRNSRSTNYLKEKFLQLQKIKY